VAFFSRQIRTPRERWLLCVAAIALFGLVVGAKWATVFRFGSDIPNWDQWDAEAAYLLTPWLEGQGLLGYLFHPHNEHFVVLTKLQALALVGLNGQWDARLECVINAMLHAASAVTMWRLACRAATARWHGPLLVLTAVLFGLPLAWENILNGFHSQQYWLIGLTLAAIALLPFSRAGSAKWWCGALAAVLALGTMASGFLAAAVVIALVGLRVLRRDDSLRSAAPTLVLAVVVVAVGWLTRVEFPGHAELRVRTISDFFWSIAHSLAWPMRDHDWVGLLFWFPWTVTVWRMLRAPAGSPVGPALQTMAAVGGWVLLQILAAAYARGATAHYPAIRYGDTLALGALVNGALLASLLTPKHEGPQSEFTVNPLPSSRPGFGLWTAAALWVLILAAALQETMQRNFESELPGQVAYYRNAENCLRGYLATDNPALLVPADIPYPDPETLVERLSHPKLRALMPASVRAPLPLQPAAPATTGGDVFKADAAGTSPGTSPLIAQKTWGSFAASGATGQWLSAPLESPLGGWLKFETAGHLGETGTSLEIHDAVTGVARANVQASRVPGESWRTAYVDISRHPFVVVARDTDSPRWFAFSRPVEMGTLSYWAWFATKQGLLLLWISAAALLGVGVVGFFSGKTPASAQGIAPGAATKAVAPMPSA
jgi:hypothetical protein